MTPVEPVVGMEFYAGADPVARKVVRVDERHVVYLDGDDFKWRMRRAQFRSEQKFGRLHPVLWTVGPGERTNGTGRLCWSVLARHAPRGDGYYWGSDTADSIAHFAALYPTKAAAHAAGVAFGWERPVARRVVRK